MRTPLEWVISTLTGHSTAYKGDIRGKLYAEYSRASEVTGDINS